MYKVAKLMKQSVSHHSQLKMLASVLHYTFRETQYTNTTTDVQYIMTLKNITVREETLQWADNLTFCLLHAEVVLL